MEVLSGLSRALNEHDTYYLYRTLSLTMSLLKSNNITFWANGGTLLGAIRCGGVILWDDDIDIAIKEEQRLELEGLSQTAIFKQMGLKLKRPSNKYYKIVHGDNEDVWIDICLIRADGTDVRGHKKKRKYLNDELYPLRTIQFSSIREPMPIPHKSEEYLDRIFKDWRNTAIIYNHKDNKRNKETLKLTEELNKPLPYHYK